MVVFIGVVLVMVGAVFAWGAVRPNGFCGIRNRWTEADETVWDRTNRLAGECIMVWGAVLLVVGDAPRRTVVTALAVPAVLVGLISTGFAVALFARRHGRWNPATSSTAMGRAPTELVLDAVLLTIPVIGWLVLQRWLPALPARIPVHFSAMGKPTDLGNAIELVRLQHFAVVVWLLFAVGMRTLRATRPQVTTAFFVLRLGALATIQALVAASVCCASNLLRNAWFVLGPAVAVMVAGLYLVLREAVGAQPAYDVSLREAVDDGDQA